MTTTLTALETIQPPAMWDDFTFRKNDPYAHAKYEILLCWLGDVRYQSTLVIGTGSGEFAAMLAKEGALVTAIDIDDASVGLTIETARQYNVQMETGVYSLEELPEEKAYDIVVATDVLEHIEDDAAAAHKISRLVKPGGRIILTVPASPWLFGFHDSSLGHFRRYTFGSFWKRCGEPFHVEKSRYFGFFLIPAVILYSLLLKRHYPVATVGKQIQSQSLWGKGLAFIFLLEKNLSLAFGTSLLLQLKASNSRSLI